MFSQNLQKGFTIIELVAVIVILAVLAVVALPRYIGLGDDAQRAIAVSQMAAYRSGIQMLNLKWSAAGQPASAVIQGQTFEFNSNGWATGSTLNSAGCVELWNEILLEPPSIAAWPGITEEWTVFGAPTLCVYLNNNREALSGLPPYFFYYFVDVGVPTAPNFNPAGSFRAFNMN